MVSVCLPSDALSQHLLSWVSLTLDMGYLFTAAPAKGSHCSQKTSQSNHTRTIALTRCTFVGKVIEIPLVQGKEQWLCFAGAAMKIYPMPKLRETQVRW